MTAIRAKTARASSKYHYTESGLDWVYLANGFTWHETPYGAGIAVRHVDGLHAAIAHAVIGSPRQIRGQEVRFLRTMLDLSQEELARALGVKRVQVARWEGARTKPLPGTADRALRLFYAGKSGGGRLVAQIVELCDDIEAARRASEVFRETRQGWERRTKLAA